jgi:hypothetical protein
VKEKEKYILLDTLLSQYRLSYGMKSNHNFCFIIYKEPSICKYVIFIIPDLHNNPVK